MCHPDGVCPCAGHAAHVLQVVYVYNVCIFLLAMVHRKTIFTVNLPGFVLQCMKPWNDLQSDRTAN